MNKQPSPPPQTPIETNIEIVKTEASKFNGITIEQPKVLTPIVNGKPLVTGVPEIRMESFKVSYLFS